MITHKTDDEYAVPAVIVNALIISILTGLLGVAGYMVIWARSDAEFKAGMISRFSDIERRIAVIESQVGGGVLPLAKDKLESQEQRLNRLERRMDGLR